MVPENVLDHATIADEVSVLTGAPTSLPLLLTTLIADSLGHLFVPPVRAGPASYIRSPGLLIPSWSSLDKPTVARYYNSRWSRSSPWIRLNLIPRLFGASQRGRSSKGESPSEYAQLVATETVIRHGQSRLGVGSSRRKRIVRASSRISRDFTSDTVE